MKAHKLLFDAQNPKGIDLSQIKITAIQTDSREIKKNNLFVAIKGHTVDSHQFIDQVIDQGAALIVANIDQMDTLNVEGTDELNVVFVEDTYDYLSTLMNRFLDYPSHKLNVFGVTGTNGKTSTANILTQLLNEAGRNTGMIGTIGIRANNKTYPLDNTTPDPLSLQNTFDFMVDAGVQNTVMEVSSIGLAEKRTKGTDFSVAIYTNLSQDHLDFHGSMENYRDAKGIFFREMKHVNARDQKNYAVINLDDEQADYYMGLSKAKVVTYGIDKDADYKASAIRFTESGTK